MIDLANRLCAEANRAEDRLSAVLDQRECTVEDHAHGEALFDKALSTVPTTIAGIIAQAELGLRVELAEEALKTILAGARQMLVSGDKSPSALATS